ncbi:hypothetical protein ONZ45_g11190 [Pleurotus djamor]|nr:hypothetical protein ONZ45_g11190 [Pleurotus djamor]
MPYWTRWRADASVVKSIYVSIVFSLSTRYNVRRLENSSYGTWNLILSRLCKQDRQLFIVCPQYGLYVSSKDPTNADTSTATFSTTADSAAKGVIVDNSIIIPEVELREPRMFETVRIYLIHIFGKKPWLVERELVIRRAVAALLLEEKRPPPRHTTLDLYVARVQSLLNEAQHQALGQAQCLFSMPKFGYQDRVVLVATTGGWWSLRVEYRDSDPEGVFDLNQFLTDMDDKQLPDVDDDVHDPGSVLLSRTKAAEEANDTRAGATHPQLNIRQRHLPTAGLNQGVNPEDIVDSAGQGPFSSEDIDRYWTLKFHSPFCQPGNVPFEALRNNWSGPMRLGTEVSDKYLGFIEDYLSGIVNPM